jgi:enoyl-CoA hydratase/carnithine racemase
VSSPTRRGGDQPRLGPTQQFGLVNRVVDDEDLEAEVGRMTERIAGLAAEAVADNKRLINSSYEAAGFLTVRGYGED